MIKKLNKFKKVFAVACAVAVVGSFVPAVNASAATNPTVSYSVSKTEAKVNDTITVGIDVKNVSGLFGGAVDFAYDNTLFDVTTIAFGDLTNNAKADVQKISNGQANIAFTLKGDATAITKTSGRLATVTLKAKKAGSMTLKNSNDYSQLGKNGVNTIVKLADKSSNKIAYTNPTSVTIKVGNDAPTPSSDVLAPGLYQEDNANLKYTGTWQSKSSKSYLGGTLKNTATKDSAVEFKFKGTAFEWFGLKASSRGIADVYVDGKKMPSVDLYRSEILYNKVLYRSPELANTEHTVKIVCSGNKNAASKGIGIDIDQIVIKDSSLVLSAGTYEDNTISLDFIGSWVNRSSSKYSNGNLSCSITKGSECTFKFNGTSFEWYGLKAISRGIADVYIDGKKVKSVDCYSAASVYGQALYKSSNLSAGTHTVRIVTTGNKNAKATSFGIDVDKIVIK